MNRYLDSEVLISLVRDRPILWDKSREDSNLKSAMIDGWRSISAQLNADYASLSEVEQNNYTRLVRSRWKNIRDHYLKTSKKEKKGKKYIFHRHLAFLNTSAEVEETKSNVKTERGYSSERKNEERRKGNDSWSAEEENRNSDAKVDGNKTTASRTTSLRNKMDLLSAQHLITTDYRHLLFFKSMLPSLRDFSDDETLHFQYSVINVVQNIRRSRPIQTPVLPIQSSCGHHQLSPSIWNKPSPGGSQTANASGSQLLLSASHSPQSSDMSECSSLPDANVSVQSPS